MHGMWSFPGHARIAAVRGVASGVIEGSKPTGVFLRKSEAIISTLSLVIRSVTERPVLCAQFDFRLSVSSHSVTFVLASYCESALITVMESFPPKTSASLSLN